MIKAADLRIGNYILYLDELYIVDGIQYEPGAPASKWRILFRTVDDNNRANQILRNGKMENWIQPVPITPEILERCGFKDIRGEYWMCEGICIYLEDEADGVYFFADEDAHEGNINYFGNGVTFLHQLQNLFFALEGTELEINLPLPKPTDA